MRKRILALFLAVILLLLTACSFKVNNDTIYIPREKVVSAEIQKEYKEEGKDPYYCKKDLTSTADLDKICSMIRELPAKKASSEHPNPIEEANIIVILRGQKDHRLNLNKKMAFYDQVAYEYTDKNAFDQFLNFYDDIDCDEEKTDPSYY
ncbi:MAG: hypothetical protein IKK30_03830 [Clostridia bacterium]|nr:hypothetical protein [Clostridia bacterium]